MKKGFTLIELLAVIAILAIILLIAVPVISGIIAGIEKSAFEHSANLIIKAGLMDRMEAEVSNNLADMTVTYENGEAVGEDFDYNGARPESGTITIYKDGEVELAINDGKWCAIKKTNEKDITVIPYEEGTCVVNVLTCPGVEYTDIAFGNGIKAYADGDSLCLLGKDEFKVENPVVNTNVASEITTYIVDNFGEAAFENPELLFTVVYAAYFYPTEWAEIVQTPDDALFITIFTQIGEGTINPEEVLATNAAFANLYNSIPYYEVDTALATEITDFVLFMSNGEPINEEYLMVVVYTAFFHPTEWAEIVATGDDSFLSSIITQMGDGTINAEEIYNTNQSFADLYNAIPYFHYSPAFIEEVDSFLIDRFGSYDVNDINEIFAILYIAYADQEGAYDDMIAGDNSIVDTIVFNIEEGYSSIEEIIAGDVGFVEFILDLTFLDNGAPFIESSMPSDTIVIDNFFPDDNVYKLQAFTKITIRGDIEEIGNYAFSGSEVPFEGPCDNGNLMDITIESNISRIGNYAFYCNSISNVAFSNSTTSIGNYAFAFNPISTLDLPNNLITINAGAFRENLITDLDLPTTVTYIGDDSFSYNPISVVDLHNGITYLSGFMGTDISSITIPSTVTVIGYEAFSGLGLTEVSLPNSILEIRDYAFENNNISAVDLPDNLTYLSGFGYNQISSVTIPNTVVNIGEDAFNENNLSNLVLPPNVTQVGERAFNNNSIVNELALPTTIENIGYSAFGGNLISGEIDLPASLVSIGSSAFAGNNITSVQLTSSVQTYPMGVFENNALTSLTVPSGVRELDGFENNNISSLTLPSSLTKIDGFEGNALTSLTIPSGVIEIGSIAFGSNALTSISLPSTLEIIRTRAFENNTSLVGAISLPNIQSIESHAFNNCRLTGVNLGNSLITLGTNAFQFNRLTTVSFPNTLTSIGSYAFGNNTLAGTITIPASVTTIGSYAFEFNAITGVVIPEGVTQINNYAFRSNQLTNLTLPSTLNDIFPYAFSYNRLVSITFNRNANTTIRQNVFYYNGPTGTSTSSVLHCTTTNCTKISNVFGTWNYVTSAWVKQ